MRVAVAAFVLDLVLMLDCGFAAGQSSASYLITAEALGPQGGFITNSSGCGMNVGMGDSVGVCSNGPGLQVKAGFVGQLYDLTGIDVIAHPGTVNEKGTCQLLAIGSFDDGTRGALEGNPHWSTVYGPVVTIDSSGLATTRNVYQDTWARARGRYDYKTDTADFLVANVGRDDYLSYAGDGLPDDWQVAHFGEENPLAAPGQDPDGDRSDNMGEWTADTHPSNDLSVLAVTGITCSVAGARIAWQGGVLATQVLQRKSGLLPTGEQWTVLFTNVPPTPVSANFLDTAATNRIFFYRIKASRP